MNLRSLYYRCSIVFLLSLLIACSSGGGGNNPPPSTNTAPVADAGINQTVDENTVVNLDASSSTDADGDTVTFTWLQQSGTNVTLSDATIEQPSFTAPDLSVSEDLVFQVTVGDGSLTSTANVTISVNADDDAPQAEAGPDQNVLSGAVVQLDASGSSDPEGATLTYAWTGPSTVTLSDSTAVMPTYISTTTGDGSAQAQEFTVTVTDAGGNSNQDIVTVTTTTNVLQEIYSVEGANGDDVLGTSFAVLDDINNDGVNDIVVGALRFNGMAGGDSGAVYLLSGIDGSELAAIEGESSTDYFGRSLAVVSDINADGFDDIVVGANSAGASGRGKVYIYSGDPSHYAGGFIGDPLLLELEDDQSGVSDFGWSVASIADLDADGFDDVIVGAPQNNSGNGTSTGQVYVFSGGSGALLLQIDGEASDDEFGRSLSVIDSVNGDGIPDFIIGAPYHDGVAAESGRAYVYNGLLSASPLGDPLLYTIDGESLGDSLGYQVASIVDLDGDNVKEVVVSAPADTTNGAGKIHIFSGSTDAGIAPLLSIDGIETGDNFGASLVVIPDVNADGIEDIAATASYYDGPAGNDTGSLSIFSGNTTDGPIRLYFNTGENAGDAIGVVHGFADVDADGVAEILLGAPSFGTAPNDERGKIYLLSIQP